MEMADENVVVQLEDEPSAQEVLVDTGSPDGTVVDQKPDPVADLEAQVKEFQKKAKDQEAQAEAARQAAAQERALREAAAREAGQYRTEANDAQLERVLTEISSAEAEASSGETEYAIAMEKGDFAAAAKAQRKMAAAESKITRFVEAKAYLEQAKRTPQVQQRPQQVDPLEQYIRGLAPETQRWLREHRDWVLDPGKNAQLTRAHYHAVGEGLTPDTPEYFAHVETRIGLRQEQRARDEAGRFAAADGGAAPKTPTRRAAAPPAAPVNGGGATGAPAMSGNVVVLTPIEAKAATDGTHVWGEHDLKAGRIKDKSLVGSPIGATEFAKRKRAMMAEGRYDKGN